jgi:c-di-GMP-binding flagellar brake protein YcgR
MLERRTYQRDDLMQIVRYAPSPHNSDSVSKGLIKDYSNSGLCLIAHHALEEGQEIIVNSIIMPYSKKAVVRWYQDLGNAAYKIGLEFKRCVLSL